MNLIRCMFIVLATFLPDSTAWLQRQQRSVMINQCTRKSLLKSSSIHKRLASRNYQLGASTVLIPIENNSINNDLQHAERYPGERREIRIWRVVAILISVGCLMNLPALDGSVAALWNFLSTQSWFRHDMFEPVLSVGSFFLWIHGWLLFDTILDKGSDKMFPLTRLRRWSMQQRLKYRIQDRHLHDSNRQEHPFTEMSTTSKSIKIPTDIAAAVDFKPMNRWYAGWYWEMLVYLAPLWGIASFTNIFAPRRRALTWAAPKFLTVVGQIFGGLFLYDFFFYFGHVLIHKLHPRIYRMMHGKHHINSDVRASDTVRLTVSEEIIDVICSIAALRLLRAHPLSRALYDMVITFLLVELHCGYDMPWSPQNLLPQIFAGSRRHHLHHKDGKHYYQKFFKYMDDTASMFSRRKQSPSMSVK